MEKGIKKIRGQSSDCPRDFRRYEQLYSQPQLPLLQDPLLQPPPPTGLVEVIPNPERGPASIYSNFIDPQVCSRLSSMTNLRLSLSKTLSLSFGSSRANPSEGPAQPPCIRATLRAESMLFCARYSLSLSTAKSVTVNSDIKFLLVMN